MGFLPLCLKLPLVSEYAGSAGATAQGGYVSRFSFRNPYRDELGRVEAFLGKPLPGGDGEGCLIAVTKRLERIAAAVVLQQGGEDDEGRRCAEISLRTSPEVDGLHLEMVKELLEKAVQAGNERVMLRGAVSVEGDEHAALSGMGFSGTGHIETWRMSESRLGERLESACERMEARGMIPEDAFTTLAQRGWREPAVDFLNRFRPDLARNFARGAAGYDPASTLILVVGGEVCGAVFAQVVDTESCVSFRILDEKLRGALSWANLVLLRDCVRVGDGYGVETSRFEVEPGAENDGTRLMARQCGAELILKTERMEWLKA